VSTLGGSMPHCLYRPCGGSSWRWPPRGRPLRGPCRPLRLRPFGGLLSRWPDCWLRSRPPCWNRRRRPLVRPPPTGVCHRGGLQVLSSDAERVKAPSRALASSGGGLRRPAGVPGAPPFSSWGPLPHHHHHPWSRNPLRSRGRTPPQSRRLRRWFQRRLWDGGVSRSRSPGVPWWDGGACRS
jgi:hypothetical protein